MNDKRNKQIIVRLTEEEYKALNDLVSKSFYSREEYIRRLVIYHQLPLPNPYKDSDIDYRELIRQIRAIGYNINQIAEIANATDCINEVAYRQNAKKLFSFLRQLEKIPKWIKVNDCGFM